MRNTPLLPALHGLRTARAEFLRTAGEIVVALRPRVLVADENLDFARLLQRALADVAVDSDVAHNELEVARAMQRAQYDLIIVDGCHEPCACVRPCEHVPVLFITDAGRQPFVSKLDGVAAVAAAARVLLDAG